MWVLTTVREIRKQLIQTNMAAQEMTHDLPGLPGGIGGFLWGARRLLMINYYYYYYYY